MSDPTDKLLREQAHKLATAILRDPILAYEYRKVVSSSYQDSNNEKIVTQWMTKAGYATKHAYFSEELAAAPRTNLAAWDGAYVLEVDKRALVLMELSQHGVTVAGKRASHVAFADGVLAFTAGDWSGELAFERIVPPADQPLSAGGTFQRLCSGRLWTGADKPEKANTRGATQRTELAPSPGRTPVRALLGANETAFVDAWKGEYKVTLVNGDDAKPGPDYGIAGTDKQAKLSYVTTTTVDLTDVAKRKGLRLTYADDARTFDLTFGWYSDDVKSFSGKIYLTAGAAPALANASGISSPLPNPNPEVTWSAGSQVGLGIGGFLAAVGGVIATYFMNRFAEKRVATREHEEAVAAHDATRITATRKALDVIDTALGGAVARTRTDAPEVGLFGDHGAQRLWAADEALRVEALTTALGTAAQGTLNQITQLEASRAGLDTAVADAARTRDAIDASKEPARRKAAEDAFDRATEARSKLDTDLADANRTKEEHKRDRKDLDARLERVHQMK